MLKIGRVLHHRRPDVAVKRLGREEPTVAILPSMLPILDGAAGV
jgi:hypothetical protein